MLPNSFYLINFSFCILISTISFIVSVLTIWIIYQNRRFHTFNHILICNTSVASLFYSIISILSSILGLHEEWSLNGPFCSIRAYCFNLAIAATCHSKSIHAISRLFFTVFSKHHYLHTWFVHRILILLTWFIAILICLPPLFIPGGYSLEKESRSCVISSKMYLVALYISIVSCFIPFLIIAIVYLIILSHVHRSTRRISVLNQTNVQKNQREMKLIRQMVIQSNILLSGGPLFLFLIFWHGTGNQSAPEPLYLFGFSLMTIVASVVPILQFMMNTQFKQYLMQFLHQRQTPIIMIKPIQQHVWHIV